MIGHDCRTVATCASLTADSFVTVDDPLAAGRSRHSSSPPLNLDAALVGVGGSRYSSSMTATSFPQLRRRTAIPGALMVATSGCVVPSQQECPHQASGFNDAGVPCVCIDKTSLSSHTVNFAEECDVYWAHPCPAHFFNPMETDGGPHAFYADGGPVCYG